MTDSIMESQDQEKKFTGEDVPAMHLRERLFLQDLAIAAGREADMERISGTIRISTRQPFDPGHCDACLSSAYDALARAAATVEAFLARRELHKQDHQETHKKEVTSGD